MIKLLSLWSLPHIKYLYKTRLAWRRNTKTQTELNELFAAEQFSYAYNMAAALFLIFMAVLVSTPLPLALVLTSASLLLRYLTERLYFVRVYAKPPCYNGALIESCLSTLPYAVLGKIVSMAYFYHESQAGGGPAMYAPYETKPTATNLSQTKAKPKPSQSQPPSAGTLLRCFT